MTKRNQEIDKRIRSLKRRLQKYQDLYVSARIAVKDSKECDLYLALGLTVSEEIGFLEGLLE